MARGDQLIRQWKLLHILAARRGRTVPEMMREVKCSRRTVWRDLAVLQQAGREKPLRDDIRREWLAALRGAEGRIEAVRLAVGRRRSQRQPVASRADQPGGGPGLGQATSAGRRRR